MNVENVLEEKDIQNAQDDNDFARWRAPINVVVEGNVIPTIREARVLENADERSNATANISDNCAITGRRQNERFRRKIEIQFSTTLRMVVDMANCAEPAKSSLQLLMIRSMMRQTSFRMKSGNCNIEAI
jgi:hypothetical protein